MVHTPSPMCTEVIGGSLPPYHITEHTTRWLRTASRNSNIIEDAATNHPCILVYRGRTVVYALRSVTAELNLYDVTRGNPSWEETTINLLLSIELHDLLD
jgi:hypothetical protein